MYNYVYKDVFVFIEINTKFGNNSATNSNIKGLSMWWKFFENFYSNNEALFFLLSFIIGVLPIINWLAKLIRKQEKEVDIGFLTHSFTPIKVDETMKNDLQMTYKGKKIDSIQQSYMRICNNGIKPLKREDFYGKNMKLSSTGKIIDIEIVNQRLSGGNFSIKNYKNNEYIIDFDYFESKQVIDIRVLQKEGVLSLECEAVGVGKLFKAEKTDISFILFMFLFSMFFVWGGYKSFNKIPGNWYWYLILCLCFIYFIGTVCLWVNELIKRVKTPAYLTSFKNFYKVTDCNFLNKNDFSIKEKQQ